MDILIFCIGFVIFVTYMFFLLRMINKSHKSQEKAQDKYKREIKPVAMSAHEKREFEKSWKREMYRDLRL